MIRSWKVIAPAVLSLALAGCVALEEAGETGPVKVGALAPLSGDGADYGLPLQEVAKIAVEEINAEGGVKVSGSDAKRTLELVWEDGGCNSDIANRAATKLITVDKVKVVLGGFCSSETLAAAPIAEQNKVVLLSPGSSSPKITTAGDFIFRNYPSDNTQGKVLSEYAGKKGFKKVGMLVEAQAYTEGIRDAFKENFEKAGGTVLAESYLSDASDFKSQITKLKGEGVDAYFVNPQTPAKGKLIIKQMQELGVTGPFLLNDVAIGFAELVTEYKTVLEGAVGAEAAYDRANPGVAKLQETYKSRTGKDLPYLPYMTTVYDAVYIVKEGLESAGEDSDKIKNFLYGLKDRKGLAGSLTIDSNGDPLTGHLLRTVKAGAVEDYKE